jgi:hypothetical protein
MRRTPPPSSASSSELPTASCALEILGVWSVESGDTSEKSSCREEEERKAPCQEQEVYSCEKEDEGHEDRKTIVSASG